MATTIKYIGSPNLKAMEAKQSVKLAAFPRKVAVLRVALFVPGRLESVTITSAVPETFPSASGSKDLKRMFSSTSVAKADSVANLWFCRSDRRPAEVSNAAFVYSHE